LLIQGRFGVYGSTDTAINIVFYFLLKNPRCLKNLEEELLSTFQSYGEITDDRLAKLPYLQACINEMFRMAPAFNAGILQRISKGATVDGIYIPRGVSDFQLI
jgi:cytochrome P450